MKKWIFITLLITQCLAINATRSTRNIVYGVAREALADQMGAISASRSMKVRNDQRWLTAFIKVAPGHADEVMLRYGCRLLAQAGDIVIAAIPLTSLPSMSEDAAVVRIEAGRTASLTMDTTRIAVNAMPAYETTERHQAFTGDGVVVGLMDIGFDLTHPTFFDASHTNYRIGAFWDQLSTDTIGSQFYVGRDYVGAEAILACGHSVDAKTQNHGNHTAGIAAGSGFDTLFKGIAWESEICLVSNAVSADKEYVNPDDYYKYTSATDALGFKYLYDYADSQGKPCVVSFSEGYTPYIDREDSLYSVFIDSLTSIPGHIFVAAAGNESFSMTYFEKPAGRLEAGAFLTPSNKDAMYKMKADGPVTIRLHAYDKNEKQEILTRSYASTDGRLDSVLIDTLFIGIDTCVVALERYPSAMTAVTDTIYIVVLSSSAKVTDFCHLAMLAESLETRVECFGSSNCTFANSAVDIRWNDAVIGHNILAPGCFQTAICVGATTGRNGITNNKGEWRAMVPSGIQGRRAVFSSTGPAMNGLMKPDVSAPGTNVVSAYSRYYLDQNPNNDVNVIAFSDVDGKLHPWVINSGTSMSTPVVAGAVALWLQAQPKLTQQQVKEVLRRTCTKPDPALDYPNNEYGYGTIDVYQGLLDVLQLEDVEGLSHEQPHGLRIVPQNMGLKLVFDKQPQGEFLLAIYDLSGSCVYKKQLTIHGLEKNVELPELSSGVYAVQVKCADSSINGSQLVRLCH